MSKPVCSALLCVWFLAFSQPAAATRIVVSSDDWVSVSACSVDICEPQYQGHNTQFLTNVLDWFKPQGGGIFLWYEPGGPDPNERLWLKFGSHDVVVTMDPALVAQLNAFDGVIAGYAPIDQGALIDYAFLHGGSVFLRGGWDNAGSAANEAARWHTFLGLLGLGFSTAYNNVALPPMAFGLLADVSGFATQLPYGPALFGGVNYLTMIGPQKILVTGSSVIDGQLQVFGDGAFAAFDVPEPATDVLVGSILVALALCFRRAAL